MWTKKIISMSLLLLCLLLLGSYNKLFSAKSCKQLKKLRADTPNYCGMETYGRYHIRKPFDVQCHIDLAACGDFPAQFSLGDAYQRGRHPPFTSVVVEKDLKKAHQMYSAVLNNKETSPYYRSAAEYQLGLIYREVAFYWTQRANRHGHHLSHSDVAFISSHRLRRVGKRK